MKRVLVVDVTAVLLAMTMPSGEVVTLGINTGNDRPPLAAQITSAVLGLTESDFVVNIVSLYTVGGVLEHPSFAPNEAVNLNSFDGTPEIQVVRITSTLEALALWVMAGNRPSMPVNNPALHSIDLTRLFGVIELQADGGPDDSHIVAIAGVWDPTTATVLSAYARYNSGGATAALTVKYAYTSVERIVQRMAQADIQQVAVHATNYTAGQQFTLQPDRLAAALPTGGMPSAVLYVDQYAIAAGGIAWTV